MKALTQDRDPLAARGGCSCTAPAVRPRCDFCIDPECERRGKPRGSCNCASCPHRDRCHRVLHPTIRITTRCTQRCGHCCFSCSPERSDMMSVATARAVARFLRSNAITVVNVMGGEFYLNPDWQEILDLIAAAADRVRLVSNGDWAAGGSVADRVVAWLQAHPHVHLSLSRDRWHTNGHVDRAAELCARLGISFNVAEPGQTTPDSIVPVGRGEMEAGFYAYVGTYCKSPEHRYAFLIDEQGEICRCPFGLLPFSDVFRHQDGGFAPVFRRFGEVFLRTFIPSCAVCARALVDRSFKADLYSESTASGDAE